MVTKEISEFLAERPAPSPDWPFQLEELAAAALMVECSRIDGEFVEKERDEIRRTVMEELVLDEETLESLVGVIDRREDDAWHDWLFTATIKKSFDEYERLVVIGRLWEIVLADGTIQPFEERLIARVAGELGIPKDAADQRLTIALRRHPGLISRVLDASMRPPP
jgi:uncharacterized tellurite resistance protein B-like protein